MFTRERSIYLHFIRLIYNAYNIKDTNFCRIPLFNESGGKEFDSGCLFNTKKNCNFKNVPAYDLSIPYFCGHNAHCM